MQQSLVTIKRFATPAWLNKKGEIIMAVNNEEYINQIYDASQKKQEAALKQNYDANVSALQASRQANQQNTDANLNRTYVESAQQKKGFNEIQNAQGLSSGAMAQANLARDTQLQQDLTTLRAAQQSADADIERQRNLLGQQYASAIQQAAAANDLERVKALYQAAKDEEDKLTAQKQEAGKFLYQYNNNPYYYLNALGMSDADIAGMGIKIPGQESAGGAGSTSGSGHKYSQSGMSPAEIMQMQQNINNALGTNAVAVDGIIGPETMKYAEAAQKAMDEQNAAQSKLNTAGGGGKYLQMTR